MKKEEKKVEFDLSTLSLKELIEVYEAVTEYIQYLNDRKTKIEEMGKANG